MRHRLQTKEGKKRYALRKQTPEPVFGIDRDQAGFDNSCQIKRKIAVPFRLGSRNAPLPPPTRFPDNQLRQAASGEFLGA